MSEKQESKPDAILAPITKIEAHGKVESTEPTLLEQVWGFNEGARYGTTNEQEFKDKIDDMNRPELEAISRRLGLMIVEDTARLRTNLMKDFRNHFSLLRKPTPTLVHSTIPDKISPEAAKVLSEGR